MMRLVDHAGRDTFSILNVDYIALSTFRRHLVHIISIHDHIPFLKYIGYPRTSLCLL